MQVAQSPGLPHTKPYVVVVFGRTGVGISSLLNLIAGHPISKDHSNAKTPKIKPHSTSFPSSCKQFQLYEVPGFGGTTPDATILKTIDRIERDVGIDLFIYCFRTQKTTILPEIVRGIRDSVPRSVPMMAIVTELELFKEEMDEWWDGVLEGDPRFTNGTKVERMCFGGDDRFDAHACVTTLPLDMVALSERLQKRRELSEERIRRLILENCRGIKRVPDPEPLWRKYMKNAGLDKPPPVPKSPPAPESPPVPKSPLVPDAAKGSSFINIELGIDSAALSAWEHDRLADAEALLTTVTPTSTSCDRLASRALVRARLRQWESAFADAEESIEIRPSVIGYIAKFVALVGNGELQEGFRVCDIAFQHFHSNHVTIVLLIKAVVLFMAGEYNDAISRINDLIAAVSFDSLFVVRAYMHLLLGNLHMENDDYPRAIQAFEGARTTLGIRTDPPPLIVTLISGWKFDDLANKIQQQSCEALLSAGRVKQASKSVLSLVDRNINMTESMNIWVFNFMQKCLSTPEINSDTNGGATRNIAVLVSQGASYAPHPMTRLFMQWTRSRLTTGSWNDALAVAADFTLPRFTIYQIICERLETTGRAEDAVACFNLMCNELAQDVDGESANWTQDFRSRCRRKIEDLGDNAMNAREYDEAILQYTSALSLKPITPQDLLAKRSKAHAGKGSWEDALNDADEIVRLDPSSPLGYERKHAALHGIGHYDDAMDAFDTMLLKMSQSFNPEIREQSRRYVRRPQTKETIRTIIRDTIRDSPPVLINTISGRLCNKSEQAAAFESTPAFRKLLSAMTTHIDHTSIKEEVEDFYRYTTISHRWEENEPLYEKVIKIVVYDLEASPTHEKLQMFCKIVREAGFNWAWSDTCCINKADHFVLQEALVSMFKWYEGSAMTIIFLLGVDRLAELGALTESIWNMRAWTLQEYHASKVVRIYTQDWTPYLGLAIYNHKDSPEVISEMERATGISAQALMALRPGLDNVREKLCLASMRQTTRIEDAAYSLLGIFSLSLPVVYGEGEKALGRLLAQLLTCSGDTSILAWTGRSSNFNSCLPASIAVFNQHPTTHIPPAVLDDEMQKIISGLHLLDVDMAVRLYNLVNELPVPSFSGRRMKLPCLAFKLGPLSVTQHGSERVFRAQANALGVVEIRTKEDLSRLDSLYIVHPWIDFLLDRQPLGSGIETRAEENTDITSLVGGELPSIPGPSNIVSTTQPTRTRWLMSLLGQSFGGRSVLDTMSLLPPSTVSPIEQQTRVLQFIGRLRQPFGGLLLTPTRRNVEEYRRVAAESLIRVQVEELTPVILDKLIKGVRMLDVL